MIQLRRKGGEPPLTARVFLEDGEQAVCVQLEDEQRYSHGGIRFESVCPTNASLLLSGLAGQHGVVSGMDQLAAAVREELQTLQGIFVHGYDVAQGWAGSRSSRRLRPSAFA